MRGSSPDAVARSHAAVVVLAAAAVLVVGLGQEPPRVAAEQRCEAVVRGILDGQGWLLPRMGGEVRPHKPPLLYWGSALVCKTAGEFSLFAFRLPSALAAVALLLVVLAWGRELGAPREAVVAAALLAVTYEFVVQGRRGSFEMLLAAFSNAALLAGYRACRDPRAPRVAAASALLALALLTKATPALLFAPLPLAAWAFARRRPRALLDRRAWLALLAALVGVLGWYGYVWFSAPEVRWFIEAQLLQPFGIQVGAPSTARHAHPAWWYSRTLGGKGLLLSLAIPLVALREWRGRSAEDWSSPWRLLLLAFAVPFVVLSCLPSKQDHYLLPALPALALLAGRAVVWAAGEAGGLPRLLLRMPVLLALTLATGLGMACGPMLGSLGMPMPMGAWAGGVGISALAVVSIVAHARGRIAAAALTGYLAIASGWALYFAEVRPVLSPVPTAAAPRSGEPS